MTLHVCFLTNAYMTQVGDRRLSRVLDHERGITIWDGLSNKSLLIDCINGRAILSYAGSAFVQGLPTDEWLASIVMSPEWDLYRDRQGPAMRIGPTIPTLHIKQVLDRIQSGVANGFLAETESRRRQGLHLALTALTRRRNARHVGDTKVMGWTLSHWGRTGQPVAWTKRGALTGAVRSRQCFLFAIGDVGPRGAYDDLLHEVNSCAGAVADMEDILARFIRSQAAQRSSIGPDLMAISVPVTAHNPRLRYMPDPDGGSKGPNYTPIVLSGSGALLLPLQYRAGGSIGINGLTLELVGEHSGPASIPVPLADGSYQVALQGPRTQARKLDSGSVMRSPIVRGWT